MTDDAPRGLNGEQLALAARIRARGQSMTPEQREAFVAEVERHVGASFPPIPLADFADVRIGDTVTRMLAGAPMELAVTDVHEGVIYTGDTHETTSPQWWRFDAETGAEIDEELGWGPAYGITGSYLVQAPSVRDSG